MDVQPSEMLSDARFQEIVQQMREDKGFHGYSAMQFVLHGAPEGSLLPTPIRVGRSNSPSESITCQAKEAVFLVAGAIRSGTIFPESTSDEIAMDGLSGEG